VPTVLVVDDDPSSRDFAADALSEGGYVVRTAPDGRAALAAVEAERPDVVVSDAVMPGVDGWALAARLRMRPQPIPVILMCDTAIVPPSPSVRLIARPFDAGDLLAAVAEALA
jgi:CheY-like chemotaxis protein